MQIATWNVNSLSVRLPQVLAWLAANPVDALGLQELKLVDEKFPHDAFEAAGYHAVCFGQKTYNGVAIISRAPARDVVRNIPGLADEQARVIAATLDVAGGPLRLVNCYFVNGQEPGSDKFAYKLRWLAALHDWLRQELAAHPRLVLVGDFNVAPEERDVHDPAGWAGGVLVSEPERRALRDLCNFGLVDTFRQHHQEAGRYSWWDYRHLAFPRNAGLRIDHVLATRTLAVRCTAADIDREARKGTQPSDHAPVWAEFDL